MLFKGVNLGIQCKNQDHMVLKRVNWATRIQKSGHMVLKGVIWFEMSDLGTQCTNIRLNGLERRQLCTQ